MVTTGNVQVKRDHLSLGRDMVVPEVLTEENVRPFQRLAAAMHGDCTITAEPKACRDGVRKERTLAIMQLSHGGRQSPNILGGRWPFVSPLAPSAVPLHFTSRKGREAANIGKWLSQALSMLMHKLMFQTPRAMSPGDIDTVIGAFVRGAQLAARSGFDGVELHAGHGCTCYSFPYKPGYLKCKRIELITHIFTLRSHCGILVASGRVIFIQGYVACNSSLV